MDPLCQKAMEKLRKDRHEATIEETKSIMNEAIEFEAPNPVICQMVRDLRIYPLWDAAAMWVGTGGLHEYFPHIRKIVEERL